MLFEIIGWIGTFLILVAYFLVSTKKISPDRRFYQLLNLFGAIGIILNSAVHNALPSLGLNTVWSLVAVYGLVKLRK